MKLKLNSSFVFGEPVIIALVGAVVVEDHVDLLVGSGRSAIIASRNGGSLRAFSVRSFAHGFVRWRSLKRAANRFSVPLQLIGALHRADYWGCVIGFHISPRDVEIAWMLGFSSTLSTSTFKGGFKYRPTTSAAAGAFRIRTYAPSS